MPVFLFRFGFETPIQYRNNKAHGWDDEDSQALFIECSDPDGALAWGCEVAEAFVNRLWAAHGGNGPSWKSGQFAHWIEADPDEIARAHAFGIPCVRVGEHPPI
jgi:hypothetical protein